MSLDGNDGLDTGSIGTFKEIDHSATSSFCTPIVNGEKLKICVHIDERSLKLQNSNAVQVLLYPTQEKYTLPTSNFTQLSISQGHFLPSNILTALRKIYSAYSMYSLFCLLSTHLTTAKIPLVTYSTSLKISIALAIVGVLSGF